MTSGGTEIDDLDFTAGVPSDRLADGGMLVGHIGDESVLLARRGREIFAVGATCTHYGAPLGEGLLVDDTVRCPWHHACFSLRTGEAVRAPAFKPVACWDVEERDGVIHVGTRRPPAVRRTPPSRPGLPNSVVIVGGGAAAQAAAETLRHEGYSGRLTMLSADASPPYDRPNLSKGFLAGSASDSSNPLRPPEFYAEREIDLRLGAVVGRLETAERYVELTDGTRHGYDALLLATGAQPVRLGAGDDLPHVHALRTLADSHAIVAEAAEGRRVAIIGASFIGLEVAASLRARGVEVHVIAPDRIPMQRILGPELGQAIRDLHEQHGVIFHLGTTATAIQADGVVLKTGETIGADFVVAGIGVRPAVELAEKAGLVLDRGVKVDAYLQTSAAGVYAAGDIARWPDRHSGEAIRVEHWVVAERQGQTAARNILGRQERFDCVPFFWTEQYDFSLAYVGHAERWDEAQIDGQIEARNCQVTFRRDGRAMAAAFVHRDLAGLRTELEFERAMTAAPSDSAAQFAMSSATEPRNEPGRASPAPA
jgi:NADPH-dependent 2,4-dienoyl-CoA reductase/sulfur reductase-like enzyme/nitrite reductase/ring-hydroxylating ferredoxin subunit